MNTQFTPLVKTQKTLKEEIEVISQLALNRGNAVLSCKIGTVKGLYSAYELAPSVSLMEAIALNLAEIIEELLSISVCTTSIKANKSTGKRDIFDMFRDYLISNGYSKADGTPTTTVDVYIRAIKRLLKNDDKDINIELSALIDRLRQILLYNRDEIYSEQCFNILIEILEKIIFIMETDEAEIEKSKRNHGMTLCALKCFLMFILWLMENHNRNENV